MDRSQPLTKREIIDQAQHCITMIAVTMLISSMATLFMLLS